MNRRVRACDPPRMAVLVDGHEIAVASSGASQDRTDTVLEHRRSKEIVITRGACMSDSTHRALAWVRVHRNTEVVQDCHIEHALLVSHEDADREAAAERLRALREAFAITWPKPVAPRVSPPGPVTLAGYRPPVAPTVSVEQIERVEQLAAERVGGPGFLRRAFGWAFGGDR